MITTAISFPSSSKAAGVLLLLYAFLWVIWIWPSLGESFGVGTCSFSWCHRSWGHWGCHRIHLGFAKVVLDRRSHHFERNVMNKFVRGKSMRIIYHFLQHKGEECKLKQFEQFRGWDVCYCTSKIIRTSDGILYCVYLALLLKHFV